MIALIMDVTTDDAINFENWLMAISQGRSEAHVEFIRKACLVAQKAHEGQKRESGEPYFLHSLAVANILANLRLDYKTIAAAVLHDVPEDTSVTLEDIRAMFGETVAILVDGVTKMQYIGHANDATEKSKKEKAKEKAKLESLRKMMLAMVDDVRVVLIKLADRTHNMRTLDYKTEDKRRQVAQETMEIFAPLANRLGIWQLKWELEDRSFRHLQPDVYKHIASLIDERKIARDAYIASFINILQKELAKHGIKADITGRSKHIYSIWRKMKRKGVDFDQIYDVRAVRLLVETEGDCYAALGIVHTTWKPVMGEFDDYIGSPKNNMYRSLHTAVFGPQGKTVEIQIRTYEMDNEAEYGVAAHWRYKEGRKPDETLDGKVKWMRQMLEWKDDVADAAMFIDTVKAEIFQDRVHVLTPKGDAIDLPQGSTPLDFAYAIHTEVGHHCRGAKVNGRIVPLTYQVKNGDQIEILTIKRGGPSHDWLNVHLGFIKTTRARSKVRQWFKRGNFEENITQGKSILEHELQLLGLPPTKPDKIARLFEYSKTDDFLAAIGHGEISQPQIINALKEMFENVLTKEQPKTPPPLPSSNKSAPAIRPHGIKVDGLGDMLSSLARCCRPVLGDVDIIGYVTKGRGVTIHRKDCRNLMRLAQNCPERLIIVNWGESQTEKTTYPVDIEIEAFDRPGLLHDITAVVANDKINLVNANVSTDKQKHHAKIFATIDIVDLNQLGRVLTVISHVQNVLEVRRRL